MCSNFQAVCEIERMERCFHVHGVVPVFPRETWPGYSAPYIRRGHDSADYTRELRMGQFGLLPHWAKDTKIGRQTYNSRSETSATKPVFRNAWKRGHRAIVPADWIYEPNYETGMPVRWKIRHVEDEPIGIAGLWSCWVAPDGQVIESFTLLTVNADEHPLMKRFHRPEDEKRMVVVLDPADYDRWLDCPVSEMMSMMTRYPSELLTAEPAPAPPRKKKAEIEEGKPRLI